MMFLKILKGISAFIILIIIGILAACLVPFALLAILGSLLLIIIAIIFEASNNKKEREVE